MSSRENRSGFDRLKSRLDHGYELAKQGELDAADTLLREVFSDAEAGGIHNIAARALIHLSYVADQRGAHVLGAKFLHQCLALCAEHSNDRDAAGAHWGLARSNVLLGKLDEAEGHLGQALMHAKLAGSLVREGDIYELQGEARRRRGLIRDALDYYRSAAEIYEETGAQLMILISRLAVHEVALELGLEDEAQRSFAAAEQLEDLPGAARHLNAGYARRAFMLATLGDIPAAKASLEQCARFVDAKLDYDQELESELAHGVLAVATERLGEALERFAHAKRLAQKMHNRFRLAEIRLEHAKALIAYGRLEHAQAVLLDTELAFEKFGARGFLARCQACWNQYFLAVGNQAAALSALEQARELERGLGDEAGRLVAHEVERAAQRQEQYAAKH